MRSYPIYPSFVKIRYGSTNSPTSFVVYELIGYNTKVTKAGNIEYTPVYLAVNKKGYRYKGHVITEYGLYQGHAFNLMSIGVTSEDFTNGNVVNLINKSKNLSEEQKKQYALTFGKNFRYITTLPSYTNLAISDMYRTIAEQKDDSFEEESITEATEDESINVSEQNNPSEYTNYSGAAPGADTVWAEIGKEFGIGKQRDFIPEDLDNPRLTAENKQEIENAYQQAVRDLGRRELNPNTRGGKLVRRDYLQAKAADAIFAVGTISNNNVNGGTGYAVAMAKRMGKPIHVFDYNQNQWFTWNGETFVQEDTPTLTKKYAGIGTTDIAKTKWGKDNPKYVGEELEQRSVQAIRDVYDKTFNVNVPVETTSNPFEEYRQVRINVGDSGVSVQRAIELINKLKTAEMRNEEVTGQIDDVYNSELFEDWSERKSVIELFKDKQFGNDVESLFEEYLSKDESNDINDLNTTNNISDILNRIVLDSGAFVKVDPNQLSLFDDMSDQDRKDIQNQIDEHNKKCNR